MKIFLTFIFFLVLSISSFADAGYGYRFYVQLEMNNSSKAQGYIYLHSWEKYEGFGNLKAFIKKNHPEKELRIYPNVVTVTSDYLNIDFALENSYLKIGIEDISIARENEILDFGGGVFRLKELNKEEFDLIKVKKTYSNHLNIYEIINYCHLIFYSWDNPIEDEMLNGIFKRFKHEKIKLGDSFQGSNVDKFNILLNSLKKEFLKNNILVIQYCESC